MNNQGTNEVLRMATRAEAGLDVEGSFYLPVVGRNISLDIPFHRTGNPVQDRLR